MTTAAQFCEQMGLDQTMVQSFLVFQANAGPAQLLAVCQQYGITAEWLAEIAGWPGAPISQSLIANFFASGSLSIDALPDTPPGAVATVDSVTGNDVTEGGSLSFNVHVTTVGSAAAFDLGLGGTAGLGDLRLGEYSLSDGVTVADGHVLVPAGVSSFTVTLPTLDDTSVEGTESLMLTIGGVTGTGHIADNDTAPTNTTPLMPEDLDGMLGLVQLNTATGSLSTATLRADILAHASANDYWLLFDAQGYVGAEDGVFTNAETGWSIGDQPATADTMESVFYGTLIGALKSIDNAEALQIGFFVTTHEHSLDNGDPATVNELIDILVSAFADPASPGAQAFSDADIHDAIVDVGVDLVAMVQLEPSIFHGLLNWV